MRRRVAPGISGGNGDVGLRCAKPTYSSVISSTNKKGCVPVTRYADSLAPHLWTNKKGHRKVNATHLSPRFFLGGFSMTG